MSRDERFIGPIFDESGVRFLLVYNQKLKAFHYLLDETITPNESFTPSPVDRPHPDRQAHRLRVLP